ncbi:MAG: hypothetical protein V3U20_03040 [Thermoplasmata archaeon]
MSLKARVGTRRALSKVLVFLLVLFISFYMFSPMVLAQNSPPVLSKGTVTPRKSYPNIDYLFTVTYTDVDNDPPANIKVFIDQVDYSMEEVDPTDTNYTDGKDYSFKKIMDEGSYTIYYSADDGEGNIVNTNSFTLSVTWDVGHYDIIHFIEEEIFPGLILVLVILFVVVFLLCLVSIFMVLQMRKIAKELKGRGKGQDETEGELRDENTKEEDKEKPNSVTI